MRRLASASRGCRALLCSSSLGLILWASASLAAAAASASLASLHGAPPLSCLYPAAESAFLAISYGCSLSMKGCCNPNAKVPSMHLQGVLGAWRHAEKTVNTLQDRCALGCLIVFLLMPGQGSMGIVQVLLVRCQVTPVLVLLQLSLQLHHHTTSSVHVKFMMKPALHQFRTVMKGVLQLTTPVRRLQVV